MSRACRAALPPLLLALAVPAATVSAADPPEGTRVYSSEVRRLVEKVRPTPVAEMPEVRRLLDALDAGQAGPAQLASLANFLAERALLEPAEVLCREAVRLDPANTAYWSNLGTIERHRGQLSEAAASYRKAIELDPGMATAHYNLGAAYDAMGDYDKALLEYARGIALDPSLTDPRVNPQIINNTHLAAASLLVYRSRAGSQTLPLIPVPEGE